MSLGVGFSPLRISARNNVLHCVVSGGAVVDELERGREIARALTYYQKNFTRFLAQLIGVEERLPEACNNEIRNAFTHVARAQVSPSIEEVRKEIDRAIDHIERASRDCLNRPQRVTSSTSITVKLARPVCTSSIRPFNASRPSSLRPLLPESV